MQKPQTKSLYVHDCQYETLVIYENTTFKFYFTFFYPFRVMTNTITKTRLFKYIENFITKKTWKFSDKNSDIFHISAQNIDCGYSLEPPQWGGSNEYPQSKFWAEIR